MTAGDLQKLRHHAIVAGYGLPGREAVAAIKQGGMPYFIIEYNHETTDRCAASGIFIMTGDARETQVLLTAGVERASMLVVTIPDDLVVLDIVSRALQINPKLQVIARCMYTSTGLELSRRGVTAIVAEQVVAREFSSILKHQFSAMEERDPKLPIS